MRRRRHKLQVSTFPFLAVLLCAMGALLLVLLVMDRRAHYAARARAEQAVRRAAEEEAQVSESHRFALEQACEAARAERQREYDAEHARLQGQVSQVQGEVQSVRDQFAQAADRLRAEQSEETALKQKIDAEQKAADAERQAIVQVRGEEAKNAAQSEASRQELAAMTADLARLERALADLKAAREKQQNAYSVVPYHGKKGENRRPLYIECAGEGLIFHPDRLALAESHIATDGAAEVQRRLAQQKDQLAPGQMFAPYLMLLVRPDGVVSYYRLRDALHGVKIDFGYEFIDADWTLDFPTDDAAPVRPWTTAAKPAAAAPSTTAPGAPLAGVKPGFGPLASSGGPPSAGTGGSSISDGPPANGTDEPPSVAPSLSPGNPVGRGPMGGFIGSQFASLESNPNGASGDPVLTEPGGLGAASGPGRNGPQAAGPPPPPGPGSPGSVPGGATTGQGLANGAAGAVRNGSTTGAPPVPGPSHGDPSGQAAGVVALTDTQPWGPKTGPSGTAATAGPKDGSIPPPASPNGAEAKAAPGGRHEGAATGTDDDPFLRSPPSPFPNTGRLAPSLRPARLSGDRDWLVYVECKPEGVVIYPTRLLVPATALARPSGSNPLLQSIQQLIDRKQASVRPGDPPYRPEVRFLVHPDAERTYHLAYPMLDGLAAPKTAQELTPDDDVPAIVTGH